MILEDDLVLLLALVDHVSSGLGSMGTDWVR